MRMMEEEKVWMVSVHLDGVAAEWFFALERDNGVMLWPRFIDFVNLRFGPSVWSNPLAELKALCLTSTDHRGRLPAEVQCANLSL